MYSLDSIYSYGTGSSGGLIAGVVIALIGTVVAAIYLFGPQKRSRFSGFMLKLYSHVNFEHYIIPMILKFLYVFTALFLIINGLVTMFSSSFFSGLLMAVLGPLAVRVAYELIMMLFSIHDGIQETNRLLRGGSQPARSTSRRQAPPQQQPDQPKHYPGGYDPMHRG